MFHGLHIHSHFAHFLPRGRALPLALGLPGLNATGEDHHDLLGAFGLLDASHLKKDVNNEKQLGHWAIGLGLKMGYTNGYTYRIPLFSCNFAGKMMTNQMILRKTPIFKQTHLITFECPNWW